MQQAWLNSNILLNMRNKNDNLEESRSLTLTTQMDFYGSEYLQGYMLQRFSLFNVWSLF